MKEFNQEGFPIIRFHDDYFEIKAIDYWEFRSFRYDEVVDLDYYHTSKNWIGLSIYFLTLYEPYTVKIKKNNGVDWKYSAPNEYSKEFASVLNEVLNRCGMKEKNWG